MVDLDNTVPFPHRRASPGKVMLAPDEQELLLEEAETAAMSTTALDAFLNMVDGWKANQWNARAQQLETLTLELTGSSREPRSDLEAPRPPEGVRDILQLYINTSREFMRRHYPPSNPGAPVGVHRGLREAEMEELRDDLFSRLAGGLAVEAVTVTTAPLSRFTVIEGIASKWGDTTAVISPTLPTDDVALAVDLLIPETVPEGEVAYVLDGPISVPSDRVSLQATRNLEAVLERVRRGEPGGYEILLTQAFRLVQGRLGRTPDVSRAARRGIARLAETALDEIDADSDDSIDRVTRDKAKRIRDEMDAGAGIERFRQQIRDGMGGGD